MKGVLAALRSLAPRTALLLAMAILLSGCTGLVSGSMRVQVDVYKGPLSKTLAIQTGELAAIISKAEPVFFALDKGIEASMCRIGCIREKTAAEREPAVFQKSLNDEEKKLLRLTPAKDTCTAKGIPQRKTRDENGNFKNNEKFDIKADSRFPDTAAYLACPALAGMRARAQEIAGIFRSPVNNKVLRGLANRVLESETGSVNSPGACADCEELSADIAEAAGRMRILANELAFGIAAVTREDRRVRIEVAKLANAAAEFAHQMAARADAIERQRSLGVKAERLPTSKYLAGTDTTAFVELYHWLDASADNTSASAEDRRFMVRELYDDDNWAQINQVYASGVGQMHMAFIKDEIGNWHLKSFTSDPSELMNMYKDLTAAAFKTARKAFTGGGGDIAASLANLAAVTTSGVPPETSQASAKGDGDDTKDKEGDDAAKPKPEPAPVKATFDGLGPADIKSTTQAEIDKLIKTAESEDPLTPAQGNEILDDAAEALERHRSMLAALRGKLKP